MALITEFARTLVPSNWVPSPSGWISGDCPMCAHNGHSHDTRGRGGIMFTDEKFQYHCFNCNYVTGWSPGNRINDRTKKLFSVFGADESDIQRLQLQLLEEQDLATILLKKQAKDAPIDIQWQEQELPKDSKPISEYTEVTPELERVLEYMMSRGLDPMDPRFYYSPSTMPARMKNRFIHVFTYQGVIVGYTARWAGTPPSKEVPKYFTKQPKTNFVYGLDRQKNKKITIVTEGQLDAYFTDGIAVGSNNINMEQGNIIDSLKNKIILLPDADKASMQLIKTAIDRGWYVSFPEWGSNINCKDSADAVLVHGELFTVRSIIEGAIHNPLAIQVMMKSYCK